MDYLDELERLAKAATPGPWVDNTCREDECFTSIVSRTKHCEVARSEDYENVRYIAALPPERVIALIAVVRAAEKMRALQGWWIKYHSDVKEFDAALAALEMRPGFHNCTAVQQADVGIKVGS